MTEIIDKNLVKLLQEQEKRQKYNKRLQFFPKIGPFRKELYPKHMRFVEAGKTFNQRGFIAGNRTGKTTLAAWEVSYHVTGDYPDDWNGKVFNEPVNCWVASVDNIKTKDILQQELLGDPMDIGSGMIPKNSILRLVRRSGCVDTYETVYIKHVSGGTSQITFKSYEQGRESFQGTKRHIIWLDEEPRDQRIFSECLTRTASACKDGSSGMILCTFTPLYALSDLVLSFLDHGRIPDSGVSTKNKYRFVVNCGWNDVPHLTEDWKDQAAASYLPHEREARINGLPYSSVGQVYPISESFITVEPFEIPKYWKKSFGMYLTSKICGIVWAAVDPDSKTTYLYSEYINERAEPVFHAEAIKSRGAWVPGVIGFPGSQSEIQRLLEFYTTRFEVAIDSACLLVESGIQEVWDNLSSGNLKIFKTLDSFFSEFRLYSRDESGKLINKNNELMNAMRFVIMSGKDFGISVSEHEDDEDNIDYNPYSRDGKDPLTRY